MWRVSDFNHVEHSFLTFVLHVEPDALAADYILGDSLNVIVVSVLDIG